MRLKLHFIMVILVAIIYMLFINYYVLNMYSELSTSDLENYQNNMELHFNWFSNNDFASDKTSIFYHILYLIDLTFKYISDKEFSALLFVIFASPVFFIYTLTAGIPNSKYFLITLPIVFMLLLTPRVIELFAAVIRTGLAFAIFYYSTQLLKGYRKYIGILVSVLIHMSMLPILAFYLFYYFVRKVTNIEFTFVTLLVLFLFSIAIMLGLNMVNPAGGNSFGLGYKAITFCLAVVFIFFSAYYSALKSVEGFVGIGLIFLILISFIFDYNLIRYIAISTIYFTTYIINTKRTAVVNLYTIAYFPFFLTYFLFWVR